MNLRDRIETLLYQYEIMQEQQPNIVLALVIEELGQALQQTEPNNHIAVQRSIAGED